MEWNTNNVRIAEKKEQFFAKLDLARKSTRVECMKILASDLIKSQEAENLEFAGKLLEQVWKEKPQENFDKSISINPLEENNQLRSKLSLAIRSYRKTVDDTRLAKPERIHLALNYGEMIIKLNQNDQYDDLIRLLTPFLEDGLAARIRYKIGSILAFVYSSKGNLRKTRYYKKMARQNSKLAAANNQFEVQTLRSVTK